MSAAEEGRGVAGDTGSEPPDPKEEAGTPEASEPKEEAGAPKTSDPKEEADASEPPDPKEDADTPEPPEPKEEADAPEPSEPEAKAEPSEPPEPEGKASGSESAGPEADAVESKPPEPKVSRVGFGVPELPEAKRMERLHCAGRQVPSPVGGFVMALGVRQEEDRTSTILFECKTSALRYELPMRVSGWRERRKVRIQVEEGLDPLCPRAELGPPLVRRGKDFYCPRCNIWFGRVP